MSEIFKNLINAPDDPDKGLGRMPAVDFRDLKYLLPQRLASSSSITYKYWNTGPVLDQGDTPQCVA